MLRGLTGTAAILLLTGALHAAEVRVTIVDRSPAQRCSRDASILATSSDSPAKTIELSSLPATLDDARTWQIRGKARECWSTTATWTQFVPAEVMIELHPAATLHGVFSGKERTGFPQLQASAFRIPPDGRTRRTLPDAEPLECSTDFPRWTCSIPASLPIDVRIEPPGYAPVYAWNILAQPSQRRDTGTQELVPGSSLAGWVESVDGEPLGGAVVTLAPLQADSTGRISAAQYRGTSNDRGFFQIAGIAPGEYRMVSRARDLAPVVVPALTVRPATASTWPRALRHVPALAFQLTIDPPAASDGSSWNVLLNERIPLVPGAPPDAITLSRDDNGVWSAKGIRPDRYELVIRDGNGLIAERRELDFSDGAPEMLAVTITAIEVAGVVRVGDEPLAAADVRFTNDRGQRFFVTSREDGTFQASFPAEGRWTPLVYPLGKLQRAQIRAGALEIARDTHAIEIRLPGGRIRGRVVTESGTAVPAAVHVVKESALVAQQVTAADGKFDFIGLAEATYAVSAEADAGASGKPLDVLLGDGETKELELVLEPYRFLRGIVQTPDGRPAGGAVVRISTDGGLLWTDLVAGPEGNFESVVPNGMREVELVVVSYSYPSAMLRVPTGQREPLAIRLQPQGGILRVEPNRGYVLRQNVVAPLMALQLPNAGVEPVVRLEPGGYRICPGPRNDEECRDVQIAPGVTSTVDFSKETAR